MKRNKVLVDLGCNGKHVQLFNIAANIERNVPTPMEFHPNVLEYVSCKRPQVTVDFVRKEGNPIERRTYKKMIVIYKRKKMYWRFWGRIK